MTGDKKSSGIDLSARLKRPGKLAARTSKSPSPAISTPPRAAIAPIESKKEDSVQRRKKPLNDMLSSKPKQETSSHGSPPQQVPERQHTANSSIGSITSIQDAKAADRIAELERALVVAQEGQKALKEELEKVRQHGYVYKEAMEDYRRQLTDAYSPDSHSASPSRTRSSMEHGSEALEHRPISAREHENLMEQNYELGEKISELQEHIVEQDALYRARLEQEHSRGEHEWNELAARVHHAEKESQERLQQLLELKHSISALTRMESQVTDGELADRMDQLYHRVREWVISNYRRTKLDFTALSQESAQFLSLIYPNYPNTASADRLALYQAIVSSHLANILHEPLILGLPETGPLSSIRQTAMTIRIGSPAALYREWRRCTIRALDQSLVQRQIAAEEDRVLHSLSSQIQHQLFAITGVSVAGPAQSALIGILSSASDLQRTLALQKALYMTHFFQSQGQEDVAYNESRMESINDERMDDDVGSHRLFSFCVFPLLEKFGDEAGENMDVRNVLLKAKVCCGVG